MREFFHNKVVWGALFVMVIALMSVVVWRQARGVGTTPRFAPGETLNPNCSPADPECAVTSVRAGKTFTVANIAEMNALTGLQEGDHAFVSDVNKTFVYNSGVWSELLSPHTTVYVVSDLAARDALSEPNIGDMAIVTGFNKTYVYTQGHSWQEIVASPNILRLSNTYVVADNTARDSLADLQTGDIAIVTDSDKTYIYTQDNSWQQILAPTTNQVLSVNAQTGAVVLNTDNIDQGATNKYFSNDAARLAFSATSPIVLNSGTGEISLTTPISTANGGTGLITHGTANQILGENSGATALEYKTVTAGSNIAITNGTGTLTAAVVGSPSFGNTAVTGLTIGSGVTISKYLSVTQASVVSASVAARTCVDYATITVSGATVGSSVIATPQPVTNGIETANLSWNAFVSAANTVKIRACNPTGGAINTPDTQTWVVDAWVH